MADAAPCVLIVMGVSGSGKSTIAKALAQRLRWTYADGDSFHPAANVEKMKAGHPLTDADREPWLRAIATEIDRASARSERLVVACSALKRSYRDILAHGRADVRFIFLDGDRALIAERLARRKDHFMPADLLDSQFAALERPQTDEAAIAIPIHAEIDAIVSNIVSRLNDRI